MFAGKIADRALLYSDFEFLGVNRKKGGKEERRADRGEDKDATCGRARGKRKEEISRWSAATRKEGERWNPIESVHRFTAIIFPVHPSPIVSGREAAE